MNQKSNIIHGIEAKTSRSVTDQDDRVRCLTLNFFSYKMLIPNACVAEVIELSNIEPMLGAPEWFGGIMKWREQDVPVIVFEKRTAFYQETDRLSCVLLIVLLVFYRQSPIPELESLC